GRGVEADRGRDPRLLVRPEALPRGRAEQTVQGARTDHVSDTKNMTKAQAKKEVQKLLAQAEGLLEEAGRLMDEHQFTADFMERNYFPRGMVLKPYDDSDSDEWGWVYPEADGM